MSERDIGEIRYEFDPQNPPTMSPEQTSRLKAMTDEDIDFSDIPDQGGKSDWFQGGPMMLMLDADLLSFFRESEEGLGKKVNAVLREYAAAHRKQA